VRNWLVWLGPVVTATAAGGLYVWYETAAASAVLATATPRFSSSAAVLGKNSELDEMGRQLADKLGQDAQPATESARHNAGDLRELSKRLAEKLERDPQNGPGWALLARSYSNTGQFSAAERTFAKAAKLQPNDASLFVDWADAYLSAHEGRWDQSAAGIVKQALAIDPKLPKALALAGAEASARGDYKAAADYWTLAKAAVPPDSAAAREAEANLKKAKARSAAKG